MAIYALASHLRRRRLRAEKIWKEPPVIFDISVNPRNPTSSCVNDENIEYSFIHILPSKCGWNESDEKAEYHTFRMLVDAANYWLHRNGEKWQVISCESVQEKYQHNFT